MFDKQQQAERKKEIQSAIANCLRKKRHIMLANARGKRPYVNNDIGVLLRHFYINEYKEKFHSLRRISRLLKLDQRCLHCFIAEFRVMHIDLKAGEDVLVKVYGKEWLKPVEAMVEDIKWRCNKSYNLDLAFRIDLDSTFVFYETYE